MRDRTIAIIIVAATMLTAACGKKPGKPARAAGKDNQAVMVEELVPGALSDYVQISGKLEGITDITMSSETSGRILQLYKRLGDYVGKGERIGMVENEVLQIRQTQAEAAMTSAEIAMQNAKKNLDYANATRAKNLISEAEYNSAASAYNAAKAAFDGAKAGAEAARLAVSNSYLIAPEAGTISNLMVASGQFINAGTPIAKITDTKSLVLKSGVGESQISKLKKGLGAEISYVGSKQLFHGTVRGFGSSPITNTANYAVEIEIPGNSTLMPGMVVSAKILTNRYKDLLYTGIANISKEFGRDYVYVVENDKAIKKEVTLGKIIGTEVEILSGVEPGELLVTTGAENLEDGTPVTIRK